MRSGAFAPPHRPDAVRALWRVARLPYAVVLYVVLLAGCTPEETDEPVVAEPVALESAPGAEGGSPAEAAVVPTGRGHDESKQEPEQESRNVLLVDTSPEAGEPEGLEHLDTGGLDVDFGELTLHDLEAEASNPLAGCVICHVDVGDAFEGSRHHREEIACTDCHGPSEGHVADENNAVKPDEVFAREDVDRLCGECHDCSRSGAAKPPDPLPEAWKVCTECHRSHELIVPSE